MIKNKKKINWKKILSMKMIYVILIMIGNMKTNKKNNGNYMTIKFVCY
jgi:hypothetical protein